MRQSPFLCGAAVGTVAVSLSILALFAILALNVQELTRHWSEEIQVTVYMDVPPQEEALGEWIEKIEGYPEVEKVSYVSRGEAFDRFRERLSEDADLLEGLEPDILPASLGIGLKENFRNRAGAETLIEKLRENPSFSDFRYGQEWLERFETFADMLQMIVTVLGGFLLFATLFIVSNTIKLTLYARREELEVMALVGGTPLFIKTPFLLEGALQGTLGGLMALAGAFVFFELFLLEGLAALPFFSGLYGIIFLPGSHQLLLVLSGTTLGLFGSFISLRKFVRI